MGNVFFIYETGVANMCPFLIRLKLGWNRPDYVSQELVQGEQIKT